MCLQEIHPLLLNKYSPHPNWIELSAQERFPLVLTHMRRLFPVTSQEITLCQLRSFTPLWDGWKSPGGRCGRRGTNIWEERALEDFSQSRWGQTAGGKHSRAQRQGETGSTQEICFPNTNWALRTYSRWAQASTGYRKHSAWYYPFSFNLKFTQLLESWNSLPTLLPRKSWNKLGWFWQQWCNSMLMHYQALCKFGNKTFPASLSDPLL